MMNPDPRLRCLNSRGGMSPKKRWKKSSLPKKRSKEGSLNGERNPPARSVFVVLMLTTEGFIFSTRSANDVGAPFGPSKVETADTTWTSGPGADGMKDDLRTSTTETMKKPIKQDNRKNMNVFLLLDFSFMETSYGFQTPVLRMRFLLQHPAEDYREA